MLSIIVIAKNEQERIKACLESVKWADELIVIDNQSTDLTAKIAKEYTRNVFSFVGNDFAALRNEAMKRATGDWVLFVDADERVLSSLRKEISILIGLADHSAYAISRRNIIFGQEVKYGPYQKDWVIRLLKKSDFETWIGKVHEYPKFKGKLGYTQNSLLHLTHRNVDHFITKSLEWSKIDARLRLEANHPKMSGWRFLRVLFTELFNQGIVRKGFFNGSVGAIDSVLQAFSLYITYVRLWEMQQKEDLNEKYQKIDQQLLSNNFQY